MTSCSACCRDNGNRKMQRVPHGPIRRDYRQRTELVPVCDSVSPHRSTPHCAMDSKWTRAGYGASSGEGFDEKGQLCFPSQYPYPVLQDQLCRPSRARQASQVSPHGARPHVQEQGTLWIKVGEASSPHANPQIPSCYHERDLKWPSRETRGS